MAAESSPLSAQFSASVPVEIIKSASDESLYRWVELSNKLKVLLVSDAKADKSAAALSVGVGHLSDPADIPGMAHFLEHMLFLGTEKYPKDDEYQKFISANGGSSNAYTSMEETVYYFDVLSSKLEPALDRFAQFFIAPLFTEDATNREMNAVNSENQKNLQVDSWRSFQLIKHLSNPAHRFNSFGSGNLETLLTRPTAAGIEMRQALLNFHHSYYSANLMRLCILGKESLDELEKIARDMFSPVANYNVPRPYFGKDKTPPAFGKEQLGKLVRVVPVKDRRTISMMFATPPTNDYYLSKPESLLARMLGHEGAGSLFDELKKRSLANELSAGESYGAQDFGLFGVTIELTEQGLERYEDVIDFTFQYIAMMKRDGISQRYFDENKQLKEIAFRFKERGQPASYASSLVSSMHEYAPEHVLSGGSLIFEHKPEIVQEFLNCLRPENMLMTLSSHKFAADASLQMATEPWYTTQYNVSELSAEQITRWSNPPSIDAGLHLPDENIFIPKDLSVKPLHSSHHQEGGEEAAGSNGCGCHAPSNMSAKWKSVPVLLAKEPGKQLWYKQDTTFLRPTACISLSMTNREAYSSPFNALCNRFLARLAEDAFNVFVYPARCAGLQFTVTNNVEGITIQVSGYNDKSGLLLDKILSTLKQFETQFTQERFDILKESFERGYRNFDKDSSLAHSHLYTSYATLVPRYHYTEYLQILPDVTLRDVLSFSARFLRRLCLTVFVHGNMLPSDATLLFDSIKTTLNTAPLLPSEVPDCRSIELDSGKEYLLIKNEPNPEQTNSAIDVNFQIGSYVPKQAVMLMLLAQMLSTPIFHQLRTQEQIGYVVYSLTRFDFNSMGFRVCLQGTTMGPEKMEERLEAFLLSYEDTLRNTLADEEFDTYRKSLMEKKMEKPKTLKGEHSSLWSEINNGLFWFTRDEAEIEILKTLTKQEVADFFASYISPSSSTRRKLTSATLSKNHVAPAAAVAESSSSDASAAAAAELPDAVVKAMARRIVIDDIGQWKVDRKVLPGRESKPVTAAAAAS